MVNQATRVTETNSSIIDHIYTTEEKLVKDVTVPHVRISDRFPIYFRVKYTKEQIFKDGYTTITYRDVSKINKHAFIRDIANCSWVIFCQKIT